MKKKALFLMALGNLAIVGNMEADTWGYKVGSGLESAASWLWLHREKGLEVTASVVVGLMIRQSMEEAEGNHRAAKAFTAALVTQTAFIAHRYIGTADERMMASSLSNLKIKVESEVNALKASFETKNNNANKKLQEITGAELDKLKADFGAVLISFEAFAALKAAEIKAKDAVTQALKEQKAAETVIQDTFKSFIEKTEEPQRSMSTLAEVAAQLRAEEANKNNASDSSSAIATKAT